MNILRVLVVLILKQPVTSNILQELQRSPVIGIGWKKTGTTSLGVALERLRYGPICQCSSLNELRVRGGSSVDGEFATNFRLVMTAKSAFPSARFILTYRRPEVWNASVVRWIAKKPQNLRYYSWLMAQARCRIPSCYSWPSCKDNNKNDFWISSCYRHPPGYIPLPGTPAFLAHYSAHNRRLRALFQNDSSRFLELNLEDDSPEDNAVSLCRFLNISLTNPYCRSAFPHHNANPGGSPELASR
mmetsp:Transcript_7749/g.10799  ORF Transcript_7749/g.10799 Transcript_7749/m.10799 type:complete len:244 (+) Transcript_7749:25-756(+)